MSFAQEQFVEAASKTSLSFSPVSSSCSDWDNILHLSKYAPYNAVRSWDRYVEEYSASQPGSYHHLSGVYRLEGVPVAVWPLGLKAQEATLVLGSGSSFIEPPVLRGALDVEVQSEVYRQLLYIVRSYASQNGIDTLHFQGLSRENGIDGWQRFLLKRTTCSDVGYELYVDLTLSESERKDSLRKSYRSLISEGKRLWNFSVEKKLSEKQISEYRLFHKLVAGKATRSEHSWELQRQLVNNGDGFIVEGRTNTGELAAMALFVHSSAESSYAVGVYDRSLFNEPVGHAVQSIALNELQQRGLHWHRLGTRATKTDSVPPTEKEFQISRFKEGFATHLFINQTRYAATASTGRTTG